MLYTAFIASGIDEGGNMSNRNIWTNLRYFSTFEEAESLRHSMKQSDTSGTLQVKVKRCGEGGKLFVVKTRQCEVLKAVETNLELELENVKPQKKSRKSKN